MDCQNGHDSKYDEWINVKQNEMICNCSAAAVECLIRDNDKHRVIMTKI